MDETPKQKDKRKLESPGTNSPIYKQSKMAGSPDQADASTNLGSLSTRMDQMFEILNSVKKRSGWSETNVRQQNRQTQKRCSINNRR